MLAYAFRRLLWAVPTLWVVVTLTYFGVNVAFVQTRHDALQLALSGAEVPAADENYLPIYLVDGSLRDGYLFFLKDLVRLRWGESVTHQFRPVAEVVREGFAVTGRIGLLAFALAAGLGLPFGALAARRGGWLDRSVSWGATLAYGVPGPVTIILMLTLSVYLIPVRLFSVPWDADGGWRNYVLPSLVLGLGAGGYLALVARAAVLDVLGQDYVRTAHAKGLRERTVVWRHIVRNALPTILAATGRTLGVLLAGSLLVEYAYYVPGTGRLLLDAFTARDSQLILAGVCLYTSLILAANIAADVAARLADPRTRSGER